MKLKHLSVMTACLFFLSLAVYVDKNQRGTDLIAGSDFIKGLDVNSIDKIKLSFKDDKSISFKRNGNKFVLSGHKSYPASNAKINDLIFKIANLQVKEKAASSVEEDDLKKYELDEKNRHYLVEIFDSEGERTVGFRVGSSKDGGRYLYKEGKKDVYLSKNSIWLNSSYKNFVDTLLLKLQKDEIKKVSLHSDKSIELIKAEDKFQLKRPEGLKANEKKMESYVSSIGQIRFEDYYQFNDPSVFDLKYKEATIELKNGLVYKLELAKKKKDHYLKVSALLDEMPQHFTVSQSDGPDKLQGIEDVVKAQAEAQRFNIDRAGWVYKIDKGVYEKLLKKSNYFVDR